MNIQRSRLETLVCYSKQKRAPAFQTRTDISNVLIVGHHRLKFSRSKKNEKNRKKNKIINSSIHFCFSQFLKKFVSRTTANPKYHATHFQRIILLKFLLKNNKRKNENERIKEKIMSPANKHVWIDRWWSLRLRRCLRRSA